MIHEWRSYRLKPGAAGEYLALLADEGLPLVTRHLPLTGYWLAETGALNVIHHLWSYADWAERESCRAGLAQEEGWTRGFIPRAFALVEEQRNRFLTLERSSPALDAALSARKQAHPARRPGAPLFATRCAGLIHGAAPQEAVALWRPLSGDPQGPLALLPRGADPTPHTPIPEGARHEVLRPLAFSPL
ncbi:NIPSNAP family protein [Neomegalonema sp.]|uniref:NIPSNAP family protein n=1 Tax=Neomegalonema sp. TaxID=2039713 RepID=UPI002612D06E|nr:NIPSNAP family protein [Neomegalonema sp.]MDD2867875.1 NIPSNAP family protein [Neomegalonema sp.]